MNFGHLTFDDLMRENGTVPRRRDKHQTYECKLITHAYAFNVQRDEKGNEQCVVIKLNVVNKIFFIPKVTCRACMIDLRGRGNPNLGLNLSLRTDDDYH